MPLDFDKKVWLVAVDMGYGHQRAAMPLVSMAQEGRVLTANNYPGIPESDRKIWLQSERFYNFISRFKGKGWLGELAWSAFDYFQGISDFYPRRDEHRPSFQLRQIQSRIKGGWGRHLIELLLRNPLPLVTSYFAVAHMAEYWNYPAPIFAIVTDSDIPRAWAPFDPEESRITYLASSPRAAERLISYGVKRERIFTTGFPLPDTLMGPNMKIARDAVKRRIAKLDPERIFETQASGLIRQHLGRFDRKGGRKEPVSVTFAIGGAGAQIETVSKLVTSLAVLVKQKKIQLNLVAGTSAEVGRKFEHLVRKSGMETFIGTFVRIIRSDTKDEYFRTFNELLLTTDILWTKPSELSFYAALGIPLILTQPVGAHEIKNREWLLDMGAAIDGLDPASAYEWLPDLISSGRLAETALAGFAKMERQGTANVKYEVLRTKL